MKFIKVQLLDAEDRTTVLFEAMTLKELAKISGKSYVRLKRVSSVGKGKIRVNGKWAVLLTEVGDSSVVRRVI